MGLTLGDVEHIAELARLGLTDEEKILYRRQLAAILEYAATLQQVDTSAIPPTATVLPLRNVMRPDVVTLSLDPADVLVNASQAAQGQFRVHPVLGPGE